MSHHRWILGAAVGAALLLSSPAPADAQAAAPSPSPKPKRVYTLDDLKKYASPSPSPGASPAAGGTSTRGGSSASGSTTSARPGTPDTSGRPRPYRRKPQIQVDPGSEDRRVKEGERNKGMEEKPGPEVTATPPPVILPPEESGPAAPPAAPEPEMDERAQDEARWRQRAEQTRANLRQSQASVTLAEEETSTIASRLLLSTDTNEILRLRAAQRAAEERLAQARLALTGAELALTNLEEDARRNNIPPGWIRER